MCEHRTHAGPFGNLFVIYYEMMLTHRISPNCKISFAPILTRSPIESRGGSADQRDGPIDKDVLVGKGLASIRLARRDQARECSSQRAGWKQAPSLLQPFFNGLVHHLWLFSHDIMSGGGKDMQARPMLYSSEALAEKCAVLRRRQAVLVATDHQCWQ
jgi:hypothetical protein